MSSLFLDTHNVVTILKKIDAAKGFEQIIDFLSESYIHYALTVNPHIYISCLKQFWNTASVKHSDDVTRLQALVDRKKIVISEVVIREILQLDDAEGMAFLSSQWKFLIHTLLQSLSAKRTSLNEFSTAMASAVICLSKGQKFNFSKYIFDSLVRNVDSSSKFYMYPRFIQLIIQNQVGDLSTHTTRFIFPALTQKVFATMRRVRKGFSGVETPLFEGMLAAIQLAEEVIAEEQVQADDDVAAAVQENVTEDVANDAIPSPPSHDIPSPSQEQSSPPQQPQSSPLALPQGAEFPTHFQQVLDTCSALTRCVENLERDKSAQNLEIIKLKERVKRLEKANKVKSSKLRRLRKVGASKRIESSDDMEDVFNQGRMIDDLDKDEGIELAKKQAEIYHLDLDHSSKVLNVVTTASQVSAASATISAAKPSIPAAAPTVVAAYTRKRKRVIIRDPEEELSSKTPTKTPKLKDKGKGVNTPRSDEDRLKLMELMVFLLQIGKSDAAEGFEQIINFLSGSYIHYAFTVNLHIYISCIKQFWNTASVKRSDDVTRKKIVISEDVIRKILQLDDAKGVFWNTASVKRSDDVTRLQSLVDRKKIVISKDVIREILQLDDAQRREDVANDVITSPPSHDIPSTSQEQSSPPQKPQSLPQASPQGAKFPTYLFPQVLDTCSALTRHVEYLEHDKAAQKLVIIKLKARVKRLERANKVKSSKLRRLKKVGASKRIESSDDMEDVFNQGRMINDLDKDEGIKLAKIYHLDLDHPSKVLSMQEDDLEVQEVVKVVTTAKLITDVVTAATSQVSAASATISAAKPSILAAAPTVDKGKGILIETPKPMKKKDQIELDAEYTRKLHEEINKDHEEINKDIDWDAAIDHVKQKSKNPQYIKRYQVIKKRPQTKSEARKNMMIYLNNTAGYKMNFFKGMSYDEICLIFQARFDANMRFLFKSREEIEEEDQEVLKSINETPAQKVAKRRKLNDEAQKDEDLKKHLEVVDDEDDDVFTEAALIARKVPVVDYHIVLINNKPRFKIIKADETH
nr:hypothetical protein [Tanacetum cinerariifolium]